MDSSPLQSMSRICPWCATASVIAFTEESLVRALTRHLASCRGDESGSGNAGSAR